MNNLNFKIYKLYLGVLIIILGFLVTRIPYFVLDIPVFINNDGYLYYGEVVMFETGKYVHTGFPGIGYPLFLKLCELINNSLMTVVFIQSILQLISVLFFYFVFIRYYQKNIIFTAILLTGYITSDLNIYYDSVVQPDSLMGCLFILFSTILIKILNQGYSNKYYFILISITSLSILIRPNGIVYIPIILIYLIYNYQVEKNLINQLKKMLVFVVFLSSIMIFHFVCPIFKQFNLVTYPVKNQIGDSLTLESNFESPIWNKIEKLNVKNIPKVKKHISLFDFDEYSELIMSQQRGYLLNYKNDTLYLENYTDSKPIWDRLILKSTIKHDSIIIQKIKSELKLKKINSILFYPKINFQNKINHFIGFYNMFYDIRFKNKIVYNYENQNFYEFNFKSRYWLLVNNLSNSNQEYNAKVLKENFNKYENNLEGINVSKDLNYWGFKTSRYNRWFYHLFNKIQHLCFRNSLFPILFLIIYSYLLISLGKFRTNKDYIYLFLIGSIAILTNLIHSFVLDFLYLRYTYQVSFVFYIFIIFVPILVSIFNSKK